MSLQKFPELHYFLTTYFSENESDQESKAIQLFVSNSSSEKQGQVLAQIQEYSAKTTTLTEELGMEVNRWFGDESEAKAWLQGIQAALSASSGGDSVVVKDSNGTVLQEGDAVTVIKDLKVKGGSSDLKRGTLIKKIRLINDPDNIECNVDGSTLVLKTCFLKKS